MDVRDLASEKEVKKLYMSTSEVWNYHLNNVEKLITTEVLIAENKKSNIKIYLSSNGYSPELSVYNGYDVEIECMCPLNKKECDEFMVELVSSYIANDAHKEPDSSFSKPGDSLTSGFDKETEAIYEREDELYQAFLDLLQVVLQEKDRDKIEEDNGKEFISEIIDDFIDYLSGQHNISVYRPMFITDADTGEEEFTEYPYELN